MKRCLIAMCCLTIGIAFLTLDATHAEMDVVSFDAINPRPSGDVDPEMNGDVFDQFSDEDFGDMEPHGAQDPLRRWNRAMFRFNDRLYFWVLKPVVQGYRFIAPGFVRSGIQNVFDNLEFPIRFINSILQGDGRKTQVEFARFALNTTIGIGGLFNPAAHFPELQVDDEDFGQTLGYWGAGRGWYVVWPFLGPSTARDTIGMIGDGFMNPVAYVDTIDAYAGIRSIKVLNGMSFHIGDYEALIGSSIEPYEAMREFYLQFRERKLQR